jgi:Xaa-Pro dipeptidase
VHSKLLIRKQPIGDGVPMFNIERAQEYMKKRAIDAWLVHDFRCNNPVMTQIIGQNEATRRCLLCIPSAGNPKFISHLIDKEVFARLDFEKTSYTTWQELHACMEQILKPYSRVAMEYSPGATLPTMGIVDAGTVEVVRALGVEVVSSADLFQIAAASWDEAALASHLTASRQVDEIKNLAFAFIASSLRQGNEISEYDVQQFIEKQFEERDLETEDHPVVAVNGNSGNPHYEPTIDEWKPIRRGDWILIDLWARQRGEQNVFGDITWVAFAGPAPSELQKNVFEVVKGARDAVVEFLLVALQSARQVQGWELDTVARRHIEAAGFGKYFTHRTGHSIGPGNKLHALGVNLDSFETQDTRFIVPGIGFSVEPGVYLPEFGVRLEINVFVDPIEGIVIATPSQNEIVCLF